MMSFLEFTPAEKEVQSSGRTTILWWLAAVLISIAMVVGVAIAHKTCPTAPMPKAIYETMKDFSLAIGAVIGFIGIAFGHALNNHMIQMREIRSAIRARMEAAGAFAGEMLPFAGHASASYEAFVEIILEFSKHPLTAKSVKETFDKVQYSLKISAPLKTDRERFVCYNFGIPLMSDAANMFDQTVDASHPADEQSAWPQLQLISYSMEERAKNSFVVGYSLSEIASGETLKEAYKTAQSNKTYQHIIALAKQVQEVFDEHVHTPPKEDS